MRSAGLENYKGVTGQMTFDPNSKNIVPHVSRHRPRRRIQYRRYGMEKQYAEVNEDRVVYAGPSLPDAGPGPMRLVVFGPVAEQAVSASEVRAAIEPLGGRYLLAPVDADKPWGQASTDLVRLLYQENAVGIIAVGRAAGHLAEQLAVKSFVPVIADLCPTLP